MHETLIKVGPQSDFVMSKAKMVYFHAATVSVYDSQHLCMNTRSFAFRSFKTLTKNIRDFVGSRIEAPSMDLSISSIDQRVFSIKAEHVKIEVKYRLYAYLSESDKFTLLKEMRSFLKDFCKITK